jgi:hypothetical protein
VESSVSGLPDRFDDFLPPFWEPMEQFMHDLRRLEDWSSGKPLPEVFSAAGDKYIEELMQKLAGGPLGDFVKARDKVLRALEEWDELPDKLSSAVWNELGDASQIQKIHDLAHEISVADAATLKDLVDRALNDVGSPWKELILDALTEGGIFDAVLNRTDELQHAAGKLAAALDAHGETIGPIQRLHDYVGTELGIDKIRNAVNAADLAKLEAWLKKKLEDFLGKSPVVADLEKLRNAIGLLAKRWDEMYAKAKTALNRKYDFELSVAYSRATTHEALVDVEFDLAQGPGVAKALTDAIDGRFSRIMTSSLPGVFVRSAALSHGIERHSHVGLSFPFYKADIDHFNSSLAKGVATDVDGQRVLVYELESSDRVTELVKGRLARESRLALALNVPVAGKTRRASGRLTYSFQSARVAMRPLELGARLAPIVEGYFRSKFTPPHGELFDTWITELDARVPTSAPINWGTRLFPSSSLIPKKRPWRGFKRPQTSLTTSTARCPFAFSR